MCVPTSSCMNLHQHVLIIFLLLILQLGGISYICKADVKFDTVDFERLNTDAINLDIAVGIDTAGEVDDILVKWNSAKTPLVDFFYTISSKLIGSKTFALSFNWNAARSYEERKVGGGEVLVKAMKGNVIVDTTTFFINIRWAPSSPSITPAGPLTVIQGAELVLTCSSPDKGNPTGTVVWTRDTNIQNEHTNDVLIINSIDTTDSGMWTCAYTNDHGTSSNSLIVDVQVIYPASGVTLTLSSSDPYERGDSLYMTDPASGVTLTLSSSDPYERGDSLYMTVRPRCTQADAPTIIAAVFGSLLIISTVALVVFICLYCRQKKNIKGGSAQKETTVHYVNIGSETNAGVAPNTQATPEYEDVRESSSSNGQSRKTEYTTLDQNDVQQTRIRPAELTVYQSLT